MAQNQLAPVVEIPVRGRYTKWCQKVEDAILESMAKGSTVKAACAAAGINPERFYDHVNADPDFKTRVIQVRESLIGVVEHSLVAACLQVDKSGRRDIQAIKEFLHNRAADRYRERVDLHATGGFEFSDGPPEELREFTEEERQTLREIGRARILGRTGATGEVPY